MGFKFDRFVDGAIDLIVGKHGSQLISNSSVTASPLLAD
jgi:hypothetical protein